MPSNTWSGSASRLNSLLGISTWCRGNRYWASMVEGAPRLDLNGQPAGVVTAGQALYAKQQAARQRGKGRKERAKPKPLPRPLSPIPQWNRLRTEPSPSALRHPTGWRLGLLKCAIP